MTQLPEGDGPFDFLKGNGSCICQGRDEVSQHAEIASSLKGPSSSKTRFRDFVNFHRLVLENQKRSSGIHCEVYITCKQLFTKMRFAWIRQSPAPLLSSSPSPQRLDEVQHEFPLTTSFMINLGK